MIQDIYADGVSNVHVTGNMVRLDLAALQPGLQGDKGQPVYHINQRIVMPLEAFVQAFVMQDGLVKKLIEAGILTESKPANATNLAVAAKAEPVEGKETIEDKE